MKRRIVVTGVGLVTSLGNQVEDFWRRLLAGESGIRRLQLLDTKDYKVTFGGEITEWDPSTHIPHKEIKRIDRFAQFALVAGIEAVKDSGIDFSQEDPFRCGVILGSGIGGLNEIEEQHQRLLERGPDKVSPFTIPKLMANAAAGHLSIQYGIKGINTTVATACASASNALGDALRAIQYGDADVMISGGAESAITPMGVCAFANMRALSTRNDDPTAASRPFDKDRDGFVLSEGAGVCVLEEYEHARRRGARIYAEFVGYGASGDGGHITQPDEHGTGAARAMSAALGSAGIGPEEIGYINAHGTSTPLGDKAETLAVKRVFGEHAAGVSISSTKSQLGHLLGASGGVEFIISILALNHSVIPPTINYHTPDPDCDLDYTPNQPRERSLRYVMSNSFGFGGHNASVIVGRLRNGAAN